MPKKVNNNPVYTSLPNSVEAEQNIFCCIMKSSEAATEILTKLKESDFYEKSHQEIFSAAKEVYYANKTVGFANVVDQLRRSGILQQVGDVEYLTKLANILPSAAKYKENVEIVKRCSDMRKLIDVCGRIIEKAYRYDDSQDVLGYAVEKIFELTQDSQGGKMQDLREVVASVIVDIERRYVDPESSRGVLTGFTGLDKLTNGLHGGELIILAARPSVGKSAFAMNIVENSALLGKAAAIFSLEMANAQIVERLLSSLSGIPLSQIKTGELNGENDFIKLQNAHQTIVSNMKIFGNDNGMTTPSEIANQCRRLKAQGNLDMIVIDYLQLMASDLETESRQLEVAQNTRKLKMIAKELNVPIVALSQLNRAVATRTVKTGTTTQSAEPQLSDLRESGAIEQDADVVMFLHRPDGESHDEGERDLIIAKNRNGELGKVRLRWIGKLVRFQNSDFMSSQYATVSTQAQKSNEPESDVTLEGSNEESGDFYRI